MEPTPEQAAEGQAIVRVLSAVLERLVCSNAAIAQTDPGQITKFHALKAPGIGVLPYLERIHKYASCSNECFVLALIYIDRLIQRNNFLLTELNVHRVVITAILLAAKFFDDAYYNNAYYSKVGGVLVSEMNGLEVDFLFRINFSLHVTPELFEKYKAELMAHAQSMDMSMASVAPEAIMQASPNMALESHHHPTPVSAIPEGQAVVDPMVVPVGPLHQHSSVQVTPSPHHAAAPLAAPYSTGTEHYQQAEDARQQGMFMDGHNMCPNGMNQAQFLQLQRSASLPVDVTQYAKTTPSRCSDSYANAPNSAPMVSMVPQGLIDNEQYLLLNQTLFPLQTTLVHHNHATVDQQASDYHHQTSTTQQAVVNGSSYAMSGDHVGSSLVAGHY